MITESTHNAYQEQEELQLFTEFVRVSGLPVQNFEKQNQLKPDIHCYLNDGTELDFELAEAIDSGEARRSNLSNDSKSGMEDFLINLPEDRKERFQEKYGNALLFFMPKNGLNKKKWKESWPKIFEFLESLQIQKDEERNMDAPHPYNNTPKNYPGECERITISRGSFNGPVFDTVNGGFQEIHVVSEALQKKFCKRYDTQFTVHLLIHYHTASMTEYFWKEATESFIRENLSKSPFQKVWLFDQVQKSLIQFCSSEAL